MALAPGTKLGPYEIAAPLGAGGMGEVYRARDTRLGREVAVKVLPPSLAGDMERLARFDREARLLAAMSHSGIAAIYGLEDVGGTPALVMELVEGPTLAERIARGALPAGEALAVARQLAEALEYAHDHGIVHRDFKPANVKLRPDGTVKVLDFGLARALEGGTAGPASDLTQSPTLTQRMTHAGVILGTAAYMAPEQARGREADRRADVWAFGAVLFEMLTGRRGFGGETISDTLAAVMRDEPDWSALPAPGYEHYLALEGTTPVAVGALRIERDLAWLGGAATLTPWRRRGAHGALIAARLRRAARRGCRWAWVETAAPVPGRPAGSWRNLLRHGFEEVCLKPIFLWRER